MDQIVSWIEMGRQGKVGSGAEVIIFVGGSHWGRSTFGGGAQFFFDPENDKKFDPQHPKIGGLLHFWATLLQNLAIPGKKR